MDSKNTPENLKASTGKFAVIFGHPSGIALVASNYLLHDILLEMDMYYSSIILRKAVSQFNSYLASPEAQSSLSSLG